MSQYSSSFILNSNLDAIPNHDPIKPAWEDVVIKRRKPRKGISTGNIRFLDSLF